ncbi:MAG: copper amine oxidase N-terminal domain-containing protein [Anaerovorax sp.]
MKRRILALILIMICLGHFPVCSHAIDNKFVATSFTPAAIDTSDPSKIGMILNGVNVPFDVNATTINNRIMVPLRALSEALHLKVVWINATRSIFLTDNQTKIDLSIGSPLAHINGTSYTMDTSPIILHHRTMVPIRFIAEAFNMDVQWNTVASTVFINS